MKRGKTLLRIPGRDVYGQRRYPGGVVVWQGAGLLELLRTAERNAKALLCLPN
jgi:hypothetical protein